MILSSKNTKRLVVDLDGHLVRVDVILNPDGTAKTPLKAGWRDATEADVKHASESEAKRAKDEAAPHSVGGPGASTPTAAKSAKAVTP